MRRSPFRRPPAALKIVRSAEDTSSAEVFLYDEIGYWGVQARTFVKELRALDVETLHVRINSPGGAVFDGVAIFNALKEHKARVICHVDGLAASIASVIALAGDEVRIAPNAFLMIHDPWTIVIGNAKQLRKDAEMLDKIGDASILQTYLQKTGADEATVRDWMDAETWFDAEEAVAEGFVDSIETDVETAAPADSFDLSVYSRVPAALRTASPAAAERKPFTTVREFEAFLREAGLSHAAAKRIAVGGFKSDPRDEDGDHASVLESIRRVTSSLTGTPT